MAPGYKKIKYRPLFVQRHWARRWQPSLFCATEQPGGVTLSDSTATNLPKLLRYEDRNSMAFSLETRLCLSSTIAW